LPIGTCPACVCTRRSSIWSRLRRSDVHRLVAIDRPVFGGLETVGDELDGAADGVDAGAVFRGFRFVDLDLPIDAGERQTVVEIADVAARGQHGRDLGRGRGKLSRVERP
jgi:hypothetical protein